MLWVTAIYMSILSMSDMVCLVYICRNCYKCMSSGGSVWYVGF